MRHAPLPRNVETPRQVVYILNVLACFGFVVLGQEPCMFQFCFFGECLMTCMSVRNQFL